MHVSEFPRGFLGDQDRSDTDRDWIPMAPYMIRILFLEGTDNGMFTARFIIVSAEATGVQWKGFMLKIADWS